MAITNKALKNYDFNQVSVVVSLPTTIPGFPLLVAGFSGIIEGFADGTGILCAKQSAAWNFQKGNDGENLRARTNDEFWLTTLTLMQSSASNDLLSSLHIADLQTSLGVFSFAIRDGSGTTVFECNDAFISQPPDIEYAREGTTREWQIICPSVVPFIGGNNRAGLII